MAVTTCGSCSPVPPSGAGLLLVNNARGFILRTQCYDLPAAVVCATAGLHLHEGLLAALRRAGHDIAQVTLHMGYGTWKSLATEYVDEHDMDAEWCELPAQTLTAVRAAKAQGRPVVAVGTSSVRTLETFAEEILGSGELRALQRETTLFIAPPFDFRVVDHMITNFAYPQTPIMALTAAAVSLLEVASLGSHTTAAEMRALVTTLQAPVSIVGELRTHPAILVELDSSLVEQLHRLLQPYSDLEIVELRRHFRREHLTRERLIDLLIENHQAHRLASCALSAHIRHSRVI